MEFFKSMEDSLYKVMNAVNVYMADYVLIFLLVAIGLFYSVKTRFVQVRCFGEGIKKVFGEMSLKGKKQSGGVSSFQALATAVAGQVGTGNIVGASGAILLGGPGAIFWMWIIAFLGMATIYSEAVLAQDTRVTDGDGNVSGGPIFYIKKACKGKFGKFLAGFFAVSAVISLGFVGGMVQSNSIGATFETAFGVPSYVTGAVIAFAVGFIIIGGVQRIASSAEKIVPVMALLYIGGGLIVLAMNITKIPETFKMIFVYAFKPQALMGGTFGTALKMAISQGAKRGLFSNEAGMGSTPHAHALAKVKTPHEQGVVAMIGVFIDTFVVLTMTALVVISCLYTKGGHENVYDITQGFANTNMVQRAFSMNFGESFGNGYVAICLMFFAFTTIISWNLFGKINFTYLFDKKMTIVYSLVSVVCIFLGAVFKNDLLWLMQDVFNQFMVIPNVMALAILSPIVAREAKRGRGDRLK